MSKFVLVSDLHGNYPSLQAVVDKEGSDKEYVILGDIMGLLAYPEETLELVQDVGDWVLGGNHDKALFQKNEGHVVSDELSAFELEHTMDALSSEQQNWMKERPFLQVIDRGGQRICLTHALPWPEMASGYEAGNSGITKSQVPHIASVVGDDYDWVFHGHNHEQYNLDCAKFGHDVHFVNPGSLGYEQTYSIVDTDSGDVEHTSVEVDADVEEHVQNALPESAPPTSEWF